MDWLSPILTLGGYLQTQSNHNNEVKINNELTDQQLKQAEKQHYEQLNITAELHNIQHEHNMRSAAREGMRDLWAQRNQKNQTSIITLTLLYSCCFVILIEGELPINTDKTLVFIYGMVMSLQIFSITLSLILLLKVQSRMTHFNIFDRDFIYSCGQKHETFDSYYIHHCRKLKRFSILFCNVGMICIYISGIILWGSRFLLNYNSISSMIAFTIFNILGIFALLFTLNM